MAAYDRPMNHPRWTAAGYGQDVYGPQSGHGDAAGHNNSTRLISSDGYSEDTLFGL
jgi:hypothetical protein